MRKQIEFIANKYFEPLGHYKYFTKHILSENCHKLEISQFAFYNFQSIIHNIKKKLTQYSYFNAHFHLFVCVHIQCVLTILYINKCATFYCMFVVMNKMQKDHPVSTNICFSILFFFTVQLAHAVSFGAIQQ